MRMTDSSRTILPIAETLTGNLVMLAKAYAEATGVKLTTVGTNSTKTASFFVDLDTGKTSCTLRKYDLLTTWFAAQWPEDHPMPTLADPQHYPTKKAIKHDEKSHRTEAKEAGRKAKDPKDPKGGGSSTSAGPRSKRRGEGSRR
jgi:hypothetical protein